MAITVLVSSVPFLSLIITSLSAIWVVDAQEGGFSVGLYHIDSPISPFYDPTISETERVRRAIHRSIAYVNSSSQSVSLHSPKSELAYTRRGEYLMKIALGTSRFQIFAIADTGSDMTWTQCQPCTDCYQQNDDIFDPRIHSTNHRKVQCDEQRGVPCPAHSHSSCQDNLCHHFVKYGTGTNSSGTLSTDTLSMETTTGEYVTLGRFIFGCGHVQRGYFSPETAGMVGLGPGPKSLITQFGSQIHGKISYCLIPGGRGVSTIHFGHRAVVQQGPGVVTTRLIERTPRFPFYFFTLLGYTVEDEFVPFRADAGNTVIDSGSRLTYLPRDFFNRFYEAVERRTSGRQIDDPTRRDLRLCHFNNKNFRTASITVHLEGGARMHLSRDNTFFHIGNNIICFAFLPQEKSYAIYGNLAQTNFLVGYDMIARTLSFKPADCLSP